MARVDPDVPIETSIQTLAEFVAAGKIGGIGLSEVSAATIRRAHAVHPIAAVENELSLTSTTSIGNGVLETCRERRWSLPLIIEEKKSCAFADKCVILSVGITFVAYSPLSRGLMTGDIRKLSDIPENDFRRMLPRFGEDVFDENFKLVEAVERIAKDRGVSVAQVALAWVRYQGALPIPSMSSVERVVENTEVVELSVEELRAIEEILSKFEIKGKRYPVFMENLLEQ